jgi:hypothetical protein
LLLGGQVLNDSSNNTGAAKVQLNVDHSFVRSSRLGYWLFVYNAKRDAGGKSQLTLQTHILRDGNALMSSPRRDLAGDGPDPERIPCGDEVELKSLQPGRYDLKVTITDKIAGTSSSQVVDFVVR